MFFVNEAYDYYQTCGLKYADNNEKRLEKILASFKYAANTNDYDDGYKLQALLLKWWSITGVNVDTHIKCAKSIKYDKKRSFDSTLLLSSVKVRMSQYALVSISPEADPGIDRIILLFQHSHEGTDYFVVISNQLIKRKSGLLPFNRRESLRRM